MADYVISCWDNFLEKYTVLKYENRELKLLSLTHDECIELGFTERYLHWLTVKPDSECDNEEELHVTK